MNAATYLPGEFVADDIVRTIQATRFRYANEDQLQQGLAEALASFDPVREVRLDARNRIDLVCGPVGVEVKVAGNAETVTRQLARYAPHFDALVLVTTRLAHRDVPNRIGGKVVRVVLVRSNL